MALVHNANLCLLSTDALRRRRTIMLMRSYPPTTNSTPSYSTPFPGQGSDVQAAEGEPQGEDICRGNNETPILLA